MNTNYGQFIESKSLLLGWMLIGSYIGSYPLPEYKSLALLRALRCAALCSLTPMNPSIQNIIIKGPNVIKNHLENLNRFINRRLTMEGSL